MFVTILLQEDTIFLLYSPSWCKKSRAAMKIILIKGHFDKLHSVSEGWPKKRTKKHHQTPFLYILHRSKMNNSSLPDGQRNLVFLFYTKNIFLKGAIFKILQIKFKLPSNFLHCISEFHKKENIFITHPLLKYFCNAAEFTRLPIIKRSWSRKSSSSCT